MNFSTNSILQPVIEVGIPSARSILYKAPSDATFRTIVQGFLTALIIKECVSLTRYFVKSTRANSDNSLDLNRILLWAMVEDWDDLFKVFCRRMMFPRPLHLLDSPFQGMRASFDRVGWRRLGISGGIALFLLAVDVVLLFLQLPDNRHQDVRNMRKLAWHNNGTLVDVAADNVLVGSFSRVVKLNSTADDNQFIRLPSVSIERTDYRDFSETGELPVYNGKLLNCTKKEGWRMLCRIHCQNRFYQYKLRLDVSTDTNSSFFFVPMAGFNFSHARVSEYARELRSQLSISVTDSVVDGENEQQRQQQPESNNGPDSFQLYTKVEDLPPERVPLPVTYAPSATSDGRVRTVDILTHDAVATIILGSIIVSTTNESSPYVVRRLAERQTADSVISGTVAISQTPYITLLGTLIMYVILQSISIFLQTRLNLHVSSPEISALLESVGVSCTTNWGNVQVPPIKAQYSYDVNDQGEQVGHVGYLPAPFLARIRKFLDDGPYDDNDNANDDASTVGGGKQGDELSIYSGIDIATETATATDVESHMTTAEKRRRRERLENEYNVVDKGTFFEFSKFGQKDGVVRTVVLTPKIE